LLQEKNNMRRFIFGAVLLVLAGSLAATSLAQDRDRDDRHDNGKHKGWDKHGDDDRGDRHDNGRHKGWEKQEIRDEHRDWDADRDRFHPGHAYPYGRYEHVRSVFIARRMDFRTRRVVLYDNSNWVVAAYDLDRCRDWAWDRDEVYVYDDDHHPGWYLLFNARLGRYVHVEYFGLH
jgi:Ni/Co efflux regulator RcnB